MAACVLALLLAPVGCGGDKEKKPSFKGAPPTVSETAPSGTSTRTQSAPTATQPRTETSRTSPEDQPGGAGDEQPARVPASFSGRAGRISPRSVHVPPYIAVRVELHSSDGRAYGLRFPGALLRTGSGRRTDAATLSGLRPGKSVIGEQVGGGGPVRIVADAEPGP